jgi:hypothetical protein
MTNEPNYGQEQYRWTTKYKAQNHKITLCDASTGHAVRVVAMCETPATAEWIVEMINKGLDKGCTG